MWLSRKFVPGEGTKRRMILAEVWDGSPKRTEAARRGSYAFLSSAHLAALLPSLSNERTRRALIAQSPLLAPPLLSLKTPSIADPRPSVLNRPTPSVQEPRPFISHPTACAGAALGHWSLVFDPRPTQAERSLPLLEMIIRQVSSATAAWVFELRLLRRISGHSALHHAC